MNWMKNDSDAQPPRLKYRSGLSPYHMAEAFPTVLCFLHKLWMTAARKPAFGPSDFSMAQASNVQIFGRKMESELLPSARRGLCGHMYKSYPEEASSGFPPEGSAEECQNRGDGAGKLEMVEPST